MQAVRRKSIQRWSGPSIQPASPTIRRTQPYIGAPREDVGRMKFHWRQPLVANDNKRLLMYYSKRFGLPVSRVLQLARATARIHPALRILDALYTLYEAGAFDWALRPGPQFRSGSFIADTKGSHMVIPHMETWGHSYHSVQPFQMTQAYFDAAQYQVGPVLGNYRHVDKIEYIMTGSGPQSWYSERWFIPATLPAVVHMQPPVEVPPYYSPIRWVDPWIVPPNKFAPFAKPLRWQDAKINQLLRARRPFTREAPWSPIEPPTVARTPQRYISYAKSTRLRQATLYRVRGTHRRPVSRASREKKLLEALQRRLRLMVGATTELLDIGKILYKSIPQDQRKREKSYAAEMRFLWENWHKIDWTEFERQMLANELEDMLFALVGRQLSTTARQYGREIGFSTGGWDSMLEVRDGQAVWNEDGGY